MQDLIAQIHSLPEKPGIYLFRDEKGALLYVGKAKSLKSRVTSYFRSVRAIHESPLPNNLHPSPDLTPAKQLMVSRIRTIETTLVSNETEALLLEAEFIKRHRPPYNIVLADDKSYVYIKFDFDRIYPDVYPLRRPVVRRKSRSLLFGPYTSAMAAYTVLRMAKKIFPYCLNPPTSYTPPLPSEGGRSSKTLRSLRSLRGHSLAHTASREGEAERPAAQGRGRVFLRRTPSRPCLNWHLKRCPGPCMGTITPEAYANILRQMIPLFQGKYAFLIKSLTLKMRTAAAHRQYEAAALIRDQISSLRVVAEKQKIVSPQKESYDVVSLARTDEASVINLFRIRDGVLIARAAFPLRHAGADMPQELIRSFLTQYYAYSSDVPHAVYAPLPVPSPLPSRIAVRVPVRGTKRQLLRLGEENAEEELGRLTALHNLQLHNAHIALTSLAKLLKLQKLPVRIEAYDISNIQGRHAVGAMTVLLNGAPAPREYRSFTIKTVVGSNDVAMLQEILRRRLAHSVQKNKESKKQENEPHGDTNIMNLAMTYGGAKPRTESHSHKHKIPSHWLSSTGADHWPLPDLIAIDGGKPQLAAAQKMLKRYRLIIPLIGIAKGRGLAPRVRRERGEEIWSIDARKKFRLIDFQDQQTARHLLDRVRDEAHRFGIDHYRAKHGKDLTVTRLDRVPGIGPKTRTLLLKTFGAWDAVQHAEHHALIKLIGEKKARILSSSPAD